MCGSDDVFDGSEHDVGGVHVEKVVEFRHERRVFTQRVVAVFEQFGTALLFGERAAADAHVGRERAGDVADGRR